MRNLIGPLAIFVTLAVTTVAMGQTAEETAAPEGAAPAGEGSGVPSLSMGTAETNEPYVRDTFGDWQLRCVRAGEDAEICQLYQLMRDGDGNSVAEFNVFPLPEGQQAAAGANIVTPLETLLTENLRLSVDGGQAKRYPFSFCSRVGCFSRIGLTAEEVGTFRAGAAATVTIVPAAAPNETVELSLSLSGFTAGYNALVEIENERLSAE